MKLKVLLSILIALCFHFAAYGLTGKEIVEKAKANLEKMKTQDLPETVKVRVVMEIDDKNERIEREFDVFSKRYKDSEVKALIAFIRPSNMKILAHVDKEGKQNIWMKMSSGKIRKVSINIDDERSLPILSDSHFTFEDLNTEALGSLGLNFNNLQASLKNFDIKGLDNRIDTFDLQYLGDKKVADSECHMVASTLKESSKIKDFPYKKVIYYFSTSDFYPVRMDFFKRDKLYKYLELYDVKDVDGIRIPFRIIMTMANGKDKTVLKVRGIKFNAKISDSKFNKSSL